MPKASEIILLITLNLFVIVYMYKACQYHMYYIILHRKEKNIKIKINNNNNNYNKSQACLYSNQQWHRRKKLAIRNIKDITMSCRSILKI
jgi:hypothetical protein